MKRVLTGLILGAMGFSLAACGGGKTESKAAGDSASLSGSAKGFGGDVTVTLTKKDGKIIEAKIEGANETDNVGKAAIPKLQEQIVKANGADIDGVSGATVTSNAVKEAVKQALGEASPESSPAETKAEEKKESSSSSESKAEEAGGELRIGEAYASAHGEKSFAQAVAVVKGDTVLAAYVDEYQFLPKESAKGVPNADGGLAEGYTGDVVLASKRENSDYYSGLMKEKAQATGTISGGYDAIQSFAAGKTIEELEKLSSEDNAVDAVSGATLKDTAKYLAAIVEAAKNAKGNPGVSFEGDPSGLKLKFMLGAAHGDKCFSTAAVLTDGDKVVLSYLDELQFMPKDSASGVPNSDKKLGENYAEGQVLASKRVNAEYYSGLMKEKAQATKRIDEGYDAIQEAADGKTVTEIDSMAGEEKADAVSGATLKDSANYLKLIEEAAES